MTTTLLQVPVGELVPDPNQPRRVFIQAELDRLAASIASRGVLMPLRIVRDHERKCWRIVAGESRWRAAVQAGLASVPCVPVEGEPGELDLLADQIVENHVRVDLRPLDLSRAMSRLKKLKGCTSQDLASELGISGGAVTRAEALLGLPEDVQVMVDDGRLGESAAYEISRLKEPKAMRALAHEVVAGRLRRDQVVDSVRSRIGKRNVRTPKGRLSCKLDGGISVTVSSGEPLTWDGLLTALDHLKKQAKKLADSGEEVTSLARVLRAS